MRTVAPLTAAERVQFIAAARSMVETPFRHLGRSERGVDCAGLVDMALASLGRDVEQRVYGRNPVNDGLRAACQAHFGDPVPQLQAGDIALMAVWSDPDNREPNHVGILFDHPCGGLAIVHALAQAKRVIEQRVDERIAFRILEGYRP